MNIYKFINTLPTSGIAGIMTACGYALREEITLFEALRVMGFVDIDTDPIKDIFFDVELAHLALFCSTQLILKISNPFNRD